MNSFTLGGVTINSTTFPVQSQRLDFGVTSERFAHSGMAVPTFDAAEEQSPQFQFTTQDLYRAINAIGWDGADATGAQLWMTRMAHAGLRSSASDHTRVTVADGYVVPLTIQAQHGQWATMEAQIWPASTDGNDPLSFTDNVALPSPASAPSAFTVGPCEINGTAIQVQQVNLDFGVEVHARRHDGEVWPSLVSGMLAAPVIRITTDDVGELSRGTNAFGLSGAGCVLFFQKAATHGLRVAAATEEHLRVTVASGMVIAGEVDANQDAEASYEVVIHPTYDGTNAILQIAQAAIGFGA